MSISTSQVRLEMSEQGFILVTGGKEILRVGGDGSFYVKGVKAEDNDHGILYRAMSEFFIPPKQKEINDHRG